MSFIQLKQTLDTGKTKVFDVNSIDTHLGVIKWYAPWRRYVFYPRCNTLFDANCLSSLTKELEKLMSERKP